MVAPSDSGLFSAIFHAAKAADRPGLVVQWAYFPNFRLTHVIGFKGKLIKACFRALGIRYHSSPVLGAGEGDRAAVFHSPLKEALVCAGVEASKISVIGNPEAAWNAEKILKSLPYATEQPQRAAVLLVTQPYYKKDIVAVEEAVQLGFYSQLSEALLTEYPDAKFIIRVHPAEDVSAYRKALPVHDRLELCEGASDPMLYVSGLRCFVSHHSSFNETLELLAVPLLPIN
ncbi:MAG: hypothetical protein EOP06_31715, partial [Proteobacteria bacterium]